MNGWFEEKNFKNYYCAKSKYAKKDQLLTDFYSVWYDIYGSLFLTQNFEYNWKKYWTADAKKKIKIKLIGYGYTSAGIDGLFKAFAEWNKAHE